MQLEFSLPHSAFTRARHQSLSCPKSHAPFPLLASIKGSVHQDRDLVKLEDHPYSAVRNCLFNILAATFHTWRPPLHSQPEDAPWCGKKNHYHVPTMYTIQQILIYDPTCFGLRAILRDHSSYSCRNTVSHEISIFEFQGHRKRQMLESAAPKWL
jgi:hypothetical protein